MSGGFRFSVEEKGHKGGPGRTFLTRIRPVPRIERKGVEKGKEKKRAPPPKVVVEE